MQFMQELFSLRGLLSSKRKIAIGSGGIIFVIFMWWFLTQHWGFLDGKSILSSKSVPSPFSVVGCISELIQVDGLFRNMIISIMLNLSGYLEAIAVSLPLGFIIGLFPGPRALFLRYFAAFRFVPLPAIIIFFMFIFGINMNMKVQFLTVAISVYLVPAVIQRIDEVPQIYVDTVRTLGARKWHIIRHVFIPDVIAKSFDDVRNLVAISWTYITYVEMINKQEGGLGVLMYNAYFRMHQSEKLFAILLIIVILGISQDRLFMLIDKFLFSFKYAGDSK